MKDQRSEDRLDKLIQRAIDFGRPEFNPEEWKQKYPEEFQILVSRTNSPPQTNTRWYLAASIAAIAASVILVFALFSTIIPDKTDVVEIGTSARYVLPEAQNKFSEETKPCNILPPLSDSL